MVEARWEEPSDRPTDLVMSRADIVRHLETGSQERLGCSATDLIAAWRAGKLDEPGEVADLLVLAGLLGEDDPLFAG